MTKLAAIGTYVRYMKAASMLSNGALFDKESTSIIIRNSDVATFYFPYTGKEIIINTNSVKNLISNPIEANSITYGDKSTLQEYVLQQQAKEVLPIILRHRQKMGISL